MIVDRQQVIADQAVVGVLGPLGDALVHERDSGPAYELVALRIV